MTKVFKVQVKSRGRILIPNDVRLAAKIRPGDWVICQIDTIKPATEALGAAAPMKERGDKKVTKQPLKKLPKCYGHPEPECVSTCVLEPACANHWFFNHTTTVATDWCKNWKRGLTPDWPTKSKAFHIKP